MMLQKTKRVQLKGKALSELNNKIYERDGGVCIICGRFIMPDAKFHHEPCAANKSDEAEKGAMLCNSCHYERHHGQVKMHRQKVINYLYELYGGENKCLIRN